MSLKLLIVFLVFSINVYHLFGADIKAVANLQDDKFRMFSVTYLPSASDIRAIAASGAAVNWTTQSTKQQGQAHIDLVAFRHSSPGFNGNEGIGYYFGWATANTQWNVQAGTSSISAAGLEVLFYAYNVFAYYNYDKDPGFQYKLGNDVWDCTKAAADKFDCVVPGSEIKFSDLTWSPIKIVNQSCPNTQEYSKDCQVWILTTESSVATFRFKFASQPVMVDGVEVTQDKGKIDIDIRYPWSSSNVTFEPNARVGLSSFASGKAATYSATRVVKVSGGDAVSFEYDNRKAYFTWDGKAKVGNKNENVYFTTVTGEEIKNFDCAANNCGLVEGLVIAALKIINGVYEAFGWKSQLVYFSWNVDQPDLVSWDPQLGTDSGISLAFSALMLLFAMLF
jgi:hypothetical protein